MKKKVVSILLVFVLLFVSCVPVHADVVNALGIVGNVLGIAMDVVGDSSVQRELDTINNKLANNISVTDDEISSILQGLLNLQYNGTGALMGGFSGMVCSNYYGTQYQYSFSATCSDNSYFVWMGTWLACVRLDGVPAYTYKFNNGEVESNSDTTNDTGSYSISTSYGVLKYKYVGYRPDATYGYKVTNKNNTVISPFDSWNDVAKAINDKKRNVNSYSSVLQNYNKGYTSVKTSGTFKYNGKTLADYDYDWGAYIKAQGIELISYDDDGNEVKNTNVNDDSGNDDSGNDDSGNGSVLNWLKKIVETILDIPLKLIELLGDLLKSLFVPSDGYFTAKVDTIKAKFAFMDSLIDTVQVFTNFFENNTFGEPPTITVNLSSSSTSIDYGMSAKMVDFSWYAPYKDSIDFLISSILWVVFAWNTFKDLPCIIGGIGSAAHSTAAIDTDKVGSARSDD